MGHSLTQGILARQAGAYVHTGKVVPVDLEVCDLLEGQPRAHRHAAVARSAHQSLAEAVDVGVADVDDLAQLGQRGVDVVNLLRHQLQHVSRAVLGEYDAIAIEDQPADGGYSDQPHAVVVGARGQLLVL